MASAICFLVTPASSYVVGQVLFIDGGAEVTSTGDVRVFADSEILVIAVGAAAAVTTDGWAAIAGSGVSVNIDNDIQAYVGDKDFAAGSTMSRRVPTVAKNGQLGSGV